MRARLALRLTAAFGATVVGALVPGTVATVAADSLVVRCTETAPRWTAVPLPGATVSLAQDDGDACLVYAVGTDGRLHVSNDGGVHWTVRSGVPPLRRILAEHLGARSSGASVLLAESAGGGVPDILASRDGGTTFTPAVVSVDPPMGVTPVEPTVDTGVHLQGWLSAAAFRFAFVQVGAVWNRQYRIVLAARYVAPGTTTAVPTVLVSDDLGRSFTVLAGAAGHAASAVGMDDFHVWLNDAGPARGLWSSADGGLTFGQACCGDETLADVAVTNADNGQPTALLASPVGIRRVDPDGSTTVVSATDAAAVRPVSGAARRYVAVARGATGERATWVGDLGVPPRRLPGLPAACAPTGLTATSVAPTTFLLRCGNGWYRLLVDRPGGLFDDGPSVDRIPSPSPTTLPMPELRTVVLPNAAPESGAIAFDGRTLYYEQADRLTQSDRCGVIGRVDASTGTADDPLVVPGLAQRKDGTCMTGGLTVDTRRGLLYVVFFGSDPTTYSLHRVDLATREYRALGPAPFWFLSYDPGTDDLRYVRENDNMQKRVVSGVRTENVCLLALGTSAGDMSTWVSSGFGSGYVQREDDEILVQYDRRCRRLAQFQHRKFSESVRENDAMACDAQTFFPRVAIWIRDSATSTASAYAVPGGYCPLPSRTSVTTPAKARAGTTVTLCTTLRNKMTGAVAPGRQVRLRLSTGDVLTGVTDAAGRTCHRYTTPDISRAKAVLSLTAVFSGDQALYPSSARGSLTLVKDLPAVSVVLPPRAFAAAPPPPPPVHNPVPDPNPQPNPNPEAVPIPNPAPAPAAQPQPVAQNVPQGVMVHQEQEQTQLAEVTVTDVARNETAEQAMVAPRRRGPAYGTIRAAGALLLLGASMAYRRRPALATIPAKRRTRGGARA